jgi:hypothetical protein
MTDAGVISRVRVEVVAKGTGKRRAASTTRAAEAGEMLR